VRPLILALVFLPALVFANSAGPPAGSSGAPGDRTCAGSGCHTLIPGAGTLSASFGASGASGASGTSLTYIPGVPQHIVITIQDSVARRWGFQAAARVASNPKVTQAGDFEPTDLNTQVICDDGSLKPSGEACAVNPSLQFIGHTLAGTRPFTAGPVTFEFDWTPPSPGPGNVTFYIAAEAANNDGLATGDRFYTQSYTLTQTTVPKPVINNKGVVNAADSSLAIAPGGWATIYGVNLSASTRGLAATDIVNNLLPTQMAGVSVNVDNQPAFLSYVSPTQINFLPPADSKIGSVAVQVTLAGQTSTTATVTQQAIAPSLFILAGTNYVAAQHANGTPVGPPTLFFPAAGSPAQPGEVIVVYGSGFGPTIPEVPIGEVAPGVAPLPIANLFSATVNGIKTAVAYAGLSPGSIALYQFNITVPATLGIGNYSIVMQYQGKLTQPSALLTVQP
jgi:uncharacterized protein (TIGR03437 family)